VVNKLNQRKIDYKRFNCEDILRYDCTVKFDKDLSSRVLGENNYKSVWFRRTKRPEIPNLKKEERTYVLAETESLLKNIFLSITPSKWLSYPMFVYEAENKILQLKTARELGFKIPKTLITNSKEELKKFFKLCRGNVIIKPLSEGKVLYENEAKFIFTNKINEKIIDNIDNYDLTPCIYQENILKDHELRVTVVDKDAFSAAVYSQEDSMTANDWRKKNIQFHKTEIPSYLKNMCVSLIRKLNIKFGAIDLIKTPSGEYIFLEVNPNGQWAWIEAQTGLEISEAIIDYLI